MRTAFTALLTGVAMIAGHAQEPAPLFKASVDVVTIDAWAHDARRPLVDLAASDFAVRDNGVEQTIDSVGTTDSAHVVIGLDLSGSVTGATLGRLRGAVRELVAKLTERDRVSVFTFADRVRVLQRASIPSPAIDAALALANARGSTKLHDAMVVGTTLAQADSRPAVFLLFTDGQDTASWSTASRALDVIRHGNVVVYPVGAGLPVERIAPSGSDYLTHRTWIVPGRGDTLRLLQTVADISGGEFLRVDANDRFVSTFGDILDRYRQRYLLSFSPTGVKRGDGWHRLDVRLRNRPGQVVAREGYMAAPAAQ